MHHITIDHPADDSPAVAEKSQESMQPETTSSAGRHFQILGRIGRFIPSIMAIAILAGLGFYGHQSGWKLPKFSTLIGTATTEQDNWCEEHGVPETECVECHPNLLPMGKDYGWCKEHGVQNCPLCHPEVAQLKQSPIVTDTDRQRANRALALIDRVENNSICKNYRRRIQFASLEAVKKAGVDVALADRQPISESILANGNITYDQSRFASLSSRLPGTMWRVEKNVGDMVQTGDVIALVDAVEVGRAKTELIQALAQEEFQQSVLKRLGSITDIVSGGQIEKAQAEAVQARARLLSAQQGLANLGLSIKLEQLRGLPAEKLVEQLRFLGIPEHLVKHIDEESTTNLLPIKAPMDGVIVARHVVAGEAVDSSRVLFQLADTGRMWLTLSVPLEDAGKLALGQPVRFRTDGSREEISGRLVWISTAGDQRTRMVGARAELPNQSGKLRNETFGTGRIILREEKGAVVVPNEAINWEGCCNIVFVRDKGYFDSKDSPKVFHIRTVRLGSKTDKVTEIIAGVLPGEVVATKGSDVLRAQLLKNNLGEGCCDVK